MILVATVYDIVIQNDLMRCEPKQKISVRVTCMHLKRSLLQDKESAYYEELNKDWHSQTVLPKVYNQEFQECLNNFIYDVRAKDTFLLKYSTVVVWKAVKYYSVWRDSAWLCKQLKLKQNNI